MVILFVIGAITNDRVVAWANSKLDENASLLFHSFFTVLSWPLLPYIAISSFGLVGFVILYRMGRTYHIQQVVYANIEYRNSQKGPRELFKQAKQAASQINKANLRLAESVAKEEWPRFNREYGLYQDLADNPNATDRQLDRAAKQIQKRLEVVAYKMERIASDYDKAIPQLAEAYYGYGTWLQSQVGRQMRSDRMFRDFVKQNYRGMTFFRKVWDDVSKSLQGVEDERISEGVS